MESFNVTCDRSVDPPFSVGWLVRNFPEKVSRTQTHPLSHTLASSPDPTHAKLRSSRREPPHEFARQRPCGMYHSLSLADANARWSDGLKWSPRSKPEGQFFAGRGSSCPPDGISPPDGMRISPLGLGEDLIGTLNAQLDGPSAVQRPGSDEVPLW